jgi:hypothetical protein
MLYFAVVDATSEITLLTINNGVNGLLYFDACVSKLVININKYLFYNVIRTIRTQLVRILYFFK